VEVPLFDKGKPFTQEKKFRHDKLESLG